MKICEVSFTDAEGDVHRTKVQAQSLYEAAALGLRSLQRSDWIDVIGPYTRITVRVDDPPTEYFVMFAQLAQWLNRPAKARAGQMKKQRLKELLGL